MHCGVFAPQSSPSLINRGNQQLGAPSCTIRISQSRQRFCSIGTIGQRGRSRVDQFRVFASSEVMAEEEQNRALNPDVHLKVFDDGDKLSEGLAEYIEKISAAAIEKKRSCSVVLSGGSLVAALRKLTESPFLEKIDWGRWHVFWVDERVVRKDDPDSSYKLAHELFLSKVDIPIGQVYSINDALDAQPAAEDYETLLKHITKLGIAESSTKGFPRFDLILLGMGPDGHVASLFPNHPLVHEGSKWVASITDSPKPPPKRITFTFPVINSAAHIAFVASGSSKADMLKRVFGPKLPVGELPAQMVLPENGELLWFVDQPAASAIL